MQVNSSDDICLLSSLCYSSSALYASQFMCFNGTANYMMLTAYNFTNLLILFPFYIFVLWMGFRQWRLQRSINSGATSHSDVITFNIVCLEIVGVLGLALLYCAMNISSAPSLVMVLVGYFLFSISYPGQTFFHCLTCMERYLAVVHPVMYMGLRKSGGVKVRNISIGCVWLLCFGLSGITALYFPDFPTPPFAVLLIASVCVVSFCSFSVLHALIRLGLGKVGGAREQIDQSKRRALHTVMAIMGTLMLRFCGLMAFNIVFDLRVGGSSGGGCVVIISGMWLCIPSSLVLPWLFLLRTGKLTCSRCNTGATD